MGELRGLLFERIKIVYGNEHLLHKDPSGRHIERPERLEVAMDGLANIIGHGYASIVGLPELDVNSALLVHDDYYVELIRRESSKGFHYIDADTYVNEHTFNVALAYATASRIAALEAMSSREPWLILPRPPGHHAGRAGKALGALTQGFCIFNHVAVATKTLVNLGYRILVFDFDLHHGNGTQEIFWYEPRVVHVDVHQDGIYPGTGYIDDIGGEGAEGTKINIPLPPGSGDGEFMWVLEEVIAKLVEVYKPDYILVSAGFDAHKDDPLSGLNVSEELYCNYSKYLVGLLAKGRIMGLITVLEGGYGEGLRKGIRAYAEALIGLRECSSLKVREPPSYIVKEIDRLMNKYWGIEVKGKQA